MASTAQWPAASESSSARPSAGRPGTGPGGGPRPAPTSARRPATARPSRRSRRGRPVPIDQAGRRSPVSSSRALTPTGCRSASSTTAGRACGRTRAGAGRGSRPGQGGIGTGRLAPPPRRGLPRPPVAGARRGLRRARGQPRRARPCSRHRSASAARALPQPCLPAAVRVGRPRGRAGQGDHHGFEARHGCRLAGGPGRGALVAPRDQAHLVVGGTAAAEHRR